MARQRAARPQGNAKTLIMPLLRNFRSETNGTTSYSYVELDIPEIEHLGPYLEGVKVHTETMGRTTNHAWTIVVNNSLDGKAWGNEAALFSDLVADGQAVQAKYTTATSFGTRMRLSLAQKNTTGAAVESAMVSAVAFFYFRT